MSGETWTPEAAPRTGVFDFAVFDFRVFDDEDVFDPNDTEADVWTPTTPTAETWT